MSAKEPTAKEILQFASEPELACRSFRERCGIDEETSRRILERLQPFAKRAVAGDKPKLSTEPVIVDGLNTLDAMAEIDALSADIRFGAIEGVPQVDMSKPTIGDMTVFSPAEVKAAIEQPFPELIEDGRLVNPADQAAAIEHATTVGYKGVPFKKDEVSIGQYGSVIAARATEKFAGLTNNMAKYPRVSDFFVINTTQDAESFMKLLNDEVLGQYNVQEEQGNAEFGVIVLKHVQGLPRTQSALDAMPRDANGFGKSALSKAWPALIVKLDAGAWPWYDDAAVALIQGIVKATGREAWRCAWAVDKQWSWVEHWRYDKKTHDGKITETIDGEANGTVTAKALERWGVDVRYAFDDLMRCAQWETLRRWLLLPEPRPVPHSEFVSLLTGKLLIQSKDPDWIVPGWKEKFPSRKPEDGPLHLHRFYEPLKKPKHAALRFSDNAALPGPGM